MSKTLEMWHALIEDRATSLADLISGLDVSADERAGVMLLTATHFLGQLSGLLALADSQTQPMEYYINQAYRLANVGAPRQN